ncbi:hypothetical protein ODJ79_33455 [Actinoplanes sp. KI2]|uniref:hypothetical protein n=1 Tax=Actinoplanes sp. KI2 TaxID=2983315 RepID=UPI0021D58518|nr:hypothetical protein [Actinoplanes sp. KI2]MCU7728646.1 hypothetical protein [Actinoplanes sp. KI2]
MGRVLSLVAVMVTGWAAAGLLFFFHTVRVGLQNLVGLGAPRRVIDKVVESVWLALLPATPAAAAWLAARYCWTVAAWVFGLFAAALAVVLHSLISANKRRRPSRRRY